MIQPAEPPQPGTDGPTEQVMLALRRVIRAIDLHSRALSMRWGLTGPQLVLLKLLNRSGSLSVGELARAASLSQATVTGILDRLTQRELVARHRSQADRRRVEVCLTDGGRELLAQTPPLLQENFRTAFERLENWEQNLILSSLQRVVAMMEAGDIDATPILVTGPVDAAPEDTESFLGGPR